MSAARVAVAAAVSTVLGGGALWAAAAAGSVGSPEAPRPALARRYAWPVHGPVLRRFEPPGSPYGPGHRGIDIGAPPGAPVRAAERGVVAFAGRLAGERYVSIDHPDGIRTTYSWLSRVAVEAGMPVGRGEVIGSTGDGHPGAVSPHLHVGARVGETYIDPLLLLGPPGGLVHLAPLPPVEDASRP